MMLRRKGAASRISSGMVTVVLRSQEGPLETGAERCGAHGAGVSAGRVHRRGCHRECGRGCHRGCQGVAQVVASGLQ